MAYIPAEEATGSAGNVAESKSNLNELAGTQVPASRFFPPKNSLHPCNNDFLIHQWTGPVSCRSVIKGPIHLDAQWRTVHRTV